MATDKTAAMEGQYAFVENLANAIPEIKKLLAAGSSQGWSSDRFAAELQATQWWRGHSGTARGVLAKQAEDPASAKQDTAQATQHVTEIAQKMGVPLNPKQTAGLASRVLMEGLSDTDLQADVGALFQTADTTHGGTSADLAQQIRQLAGDYGVPVTDSWVNSQIQRALATGNGVEGAKAGLMAQAKSTYPGLSAEIDAGQTTKDVAQPYIAAMASTLELPETQISLSDPKIAQALQYRTPPTSATTPAKGAQPATTSTTSAAAPAPTVMPLYQFQANLRQDPRWQQTTNAKQEAYGMLSKLGQDWGFSS